MHRLFIALRPPEVVRDCLIDAMEGVEAARWQSDDQLHLTLRFVGEVDTPQANDLADALSQVRCAPFDLTITGVGAFERKGRAKALWAALAPSPALGLLHGRVERACRSVGLAPETRKFVPHVTLARLNMSSGPVGSWLATNSRLFAPEWRAERYALYESHLGDAGSQYEPVVTFPLRD